MPLNKAILKLELKKMMAKQTMPSSRIEAATRFANAYHSYATGGIAGVMTATGGTPAVIIASIMGSDNFFAGGGNGVQGYWAASVWAGPGFTGITANASGLGNLIKTQGVQIQKTAESLTSELTKDDFSNEIEVFSQQLTNVIDLFTKSITITATNITSGATSIVSIT